MFSTTLGLHREPLIVTSNAIDLESGSIDSFSVATLCRDLTIKECAICTSRLPQTRFLVYGTGATTLGSTSLVSTPTSVQVAALFGSSLVISGGDVDLGPGV